MGESSFSFLLAVLEINTFLAFWHFLWKSNEAMTMLDFHQKLAYALIFNEHRELKNNVPEYPPAKKKQKSLHHLCHALQNAHGYSNGIWDLLAQKKYQQYICTSKQCKKEIHMYCSCSPGVWMCADCFWEHIITEAFEDNQGR